MKRAHKKYLAPLFNASGYVMADGSFTLKLNVTAGFVDALKQVIAAYQVVSGKHETT